MRQQGIPHGQNFLQPGYRIGSVIIRIPARVFRISPDDALRNGAFYDRIMSCSEVTAAVVRTRDFAGLATTPK